MSDLRVSEGDKLSAGKWNGIVDRLPSTVQGFGAGQLSMHRNEITILNNSGNDRDIGECLVVDSYDGPSSSKIYNIPGNAELVCVDPVWHTSIAKLVILAEPIPDGKRGVAVVSGECIIKLSSSDPTHPFVMLDPENINKCKTSWSGIARVHELILGDDPEDDDEIVYALANFRDECNRWKYELTEDSQTPATTTAKLLDRRNVEFTTEPINLSDIDGLMDDQESGDRGWCDLCGNDFESIQAFC